MLPKLGLPLFIFLLVLLMSCNKTSSPAQTTSYTSDQQSAVHRVDKKQAINFTKDLKLTAEQEVSFTAIREKYKQQMMQLNQSEHKDKQSLMDAINLMRENQIAEINGILNEEQFVKYKKLIRN